MTIARPPRRSTTQLPAASISEIDRSINRFTSSSLTLRPQASQQKICRTPFLPPSFYDKRMATKEYPTRPRQTFYCPNSFGLKSTNRSEHNLLASLNLLEATFPPGERRSLRRPSFYHKRMATKEYPVRPRQTFYCPHSFGLKSTNRSEHNLLASLNLLEATFPPGERRSLQRPSLYDKRIGTEGYPARSDNQNGVGRRFLTIAAAHTDSIPCCQV